MLVPSEINEQAVRQKETVFCDVDLQVRTYIDDLHEFTLYCTQGLKISQRIVS